MTKLADAVDAINHYTGTDAETERILDLALPAMKYHATRFRYYHSRFDVDDLIANMQLYLLQWLRGKRQNGINQVWFSRLLYNQMIKIIISDYQSGMSYAEMCEKFNRSRAGIIKILARHGIERNRGSKKAA